MSNSFSSTRLSAARLRPSELPLSIGMKWSLGGHFFLILLILLKSLVFPDRITPYVPTLKVDLVGLPDVLKKDLANSVPHHQYNQEISRLLKKVEKEAKKTDTVSKAVPKADLKVNKDEMLLKPKRYSEKKIEKKNLLALERIKALSKIQNSVEGQTEKIPKPMLVKGNQVSPGTSLSGEAKEALVASYYDVLRDQLKDNWTLPPWIARQDLSAQVRLYLDSQGKVLKFNFKKTSGNNPFDEAVKHAIEESQPFPAPPKELADSLISDGILVGFPL